MRIQDNRQASACPLKKDSAAVKVAGLTRRFGKLIAVDNVTFEVYPGEIFGFLGSNGAGKTTMVRMLTGVMDPTRGTALIQGHDIKKSPLLSRTNIAVVPEEANVYLDLTVWDNIMLMAQLHGVSRRQRTCKAERLLEIFDLTDKKNNRARTLSKGLRQRLMLCAALVTDPKILFLDEPTSGLDVQSARLIRKTVTDLNQNGLTVFLTTHNMIEAGILCSRIAIINKGKIAAIGSPVQLRSAINARQYVQVRFSGTIPEENDLSSLPYVSGIDRDNHMIRLYTRLPGRVTTEVVRLINHRGLEITDLNICKPSLEDVFLYFTQGGEERTLS